MYCKELDVFFKEKNEFELVSSDGVTYHKEESIKLARENPEDLKAIHNVKKIFDGEYIKPPKNPESWSKESRAITALWNSRLYGVPAKPRQESGKTVKAQKETVKQLSLEL